MLDKTQIAAVLLLTLAMVEGWTVGKCT